MTAFALARNVGELGKWKRNSEFGGGLLPVSVCADLANVARQRIDFLLDRGRLWGCEFAGRRFVGVRSFEVYLMDRDARLRGGGGVAERESLGHVVVL